MCRGVWRAKVSGGVFQVAELNVRGCTGEKEDLVDKGCDGQSPCMFQVPVPGKPVCLSLTVLLQN